MLRCDETGIVAVIVTFNRREQLRRCIQAVSSQEGASCEMIVVDNGSTDGTREMLEELFGDGFEGRYVNLGENTGSAGGFHVGVREAYERGYRRIWVMDDDVVPTDTALVRLCEADDLLGGHWGYLSSLALWKDGTPNRANIQKKGVLSFVGGSDYQRGIVPVHMAAMASLYLNSQAVRDVGLPISEYFIYTDDYEYTARIAHSWPAYMVPGSVVRHNSAVNMKVDLVSESEDRLWRYRYLYRNDVHLYRRYGLRGWGYLAAKAGYTTLNVLLRERVDRRGKLQVLWSSLREGTRFNPPVRYAGMPKAKAASDGA